MAIACMGRKDMNNDLISRHTALAILRALKIAVSQSENPTNEVMDAIDMVQNVNAVDAEPVKHGIWEEDPNMWKCSECHKWLVVRLGNAGMNFCSHCGARMDGRME